MSRTWSPLFDFPILIILRILVSLTVQNPFPTTTFQIMISRILTFRRAIFPTIASQMFTISQIFNSKTVASLKFASRTTSGKLISQTHVLQIPSEKLLVLILSVKPMPKIPYGEFMLQWILSEIFMAQTPSSKLP